MATVRRRTRSFAVFAAQDDRIAAGLFLLTFVTYAFFFNGGGWNQNATFDLTRAIVEERSIIIDTYHDNTGDKSFGRHNHLYANKAPGMSFLGAVPYAPIYAIERVLRADVSSWFVTTLNMYLLSMLVCGVCGALIPAVLYLYFRRRAGASVRASLAVALIIAFGTYIWAWSTVYFAHVPTALFLLLAFLWLDRRPWLAGACAGVAGTCFYLCIPVAVAMAIFALVRSGANAIRFVAAGIPFGAALGVYHKAAFGSPWRTAVEGSGLFTTQGALLGVLLKPSGAALWGITFSKWRGLFYISPVLLFAFAGAAIMIRRRTMLRELLLIAIIVTLLVLGNISFNGWHGGSAIGPRYLLPIVPLLAIPMVFATSMVRWLWILLAAISISINFLAAAVDPMPSEPIPAPVTDYYIPVFLHGHLPWLPHQPCGHVAVNPQAVNELGPFTSYPPENRESLWAAFNLGEFIFGWGRVLSLLPVVAWMIGGTAMLWRKAAAAPG